MSRQYLYLPKILFQAQPEFRIELGGADGNTNVRGECLFYPFSGGSIIITAINGLPDGFFRFKIVSDTSGEKELPSLLSTHGFSYSMVYDGRFTPNDIDDGRILVVGADNKPFVSGRVK